MKIQLQIASYELALLAKEKGFDETSNTYYTNEAKLENWDEGEMYSNSDLNTEWFAENYPNAIAAPPLALLVDWLRIKHKLLVDSKREMLGELMDDDTPFYYDNKIWCFGIDDLKITNEGIAKMRGFMQKDYFEQFESYEEALEGGVKLALTLI